MTDREFMKMDLSAKEIARLRELFSQNDTKCLKSDKKSRKIKK